MFPSAPSARGLAALALGTAIVALAAAFALPAGAANLVKNGGFELGPDPGASMALSSGSTALQGWTVMANTIDYVGTDWSPIEGSRSLSLNDANPGGIAQSFATFPGQLYTVKFFMSGDPFTGVMHMRVSAAGQSQDYAFDAAHSWPWGMGWLENTFAFTANAATSTLQFTSLETGIYGPALDSVVVTGLSPVGVGDDLASGFALASPYPNPAPNGFSVSFTLPIASAVRLSVSNVTGREVAVLADGTLTAGSHTRSWDGRSALGSKAPPGFYIIRMLAPGVQLVRKAVLLP